VELHQVLLIPYQIVHGFTYQAAYEKNIKLKTDYSTVASCVVTYSLCSFMCCNVFPPYERNSFVAKLLLC
jgi:hypothetical protein